MPGPAAADTGAIVLGGSYRALAVVRSLGRRGVPVWVARTDDSPLAGLSRYAARTLDWRKLDAQARVEALLALARDGAQGWIVVPCDDDDTRLLANHYEQVAQTLRPAALPTERLRWALDKRQTYELARRIGIDHPQTWSPRDAAEVESLELPFPIIVKPTQRPRAVATVAPKAWPAADRAQLRAAWQEAIRLLPPEDLMLQQVVPGGGAAQLAYAALCRDGEVLASVAAQRTRQRPMDFGKASTFVETVDDAVVAGPAQRLLRETGYTGMVEVEFKQPPAGAPMLLDVNPRPWGWLSIGARAGVDFPWLLWNMLLDRPLERHYGRTGVRWVRLATDLPTAAGEFMRGRLQLREWARSIRPPVELATLSADDPVPGLVEPLALAWLVVHRRLARARL